MPPVIGLAQYEVAQRQAQRRQLVLLQQANQCVGGAPLHVQLHAVEVGQRRDPVRTAVAGQREADGARALVVARDGDRAAQDGGLQHQELLGRGQGRAVVKHQQRRGARLQQLGEARVR